MTGNGLNPTYENGDSGDGLLLLFLFLFFFFLLLLLLFYQH